MSLDSAATTYLTMEIKNAGENYLQVDRFVKENGERYNDIFDIYGLKYKNEQYFHIHYMRPLGKEKRFIRLQASGRYCAFVVDKTIPEFFLGAGIESNTYALGGGIAGALYTAGQNNKRWLKDNGDLATIYFVDSSKKNRAKTLSKKILIELCVGNNDLLDIIRKEELTAERVIDILVMLNKSLSNY